MVDLATKVMLGAKLKDLGYGTGLYRTPPYCAVKVPVFSFEKLNDANSILGPEMKSTGEVLGLGKTLSEALYKGLTAAGFTVPPTDSENAPGVLISVDNTDYEEVLSVAKRFYDLRMDLYATPGTADAISKLGIPVISVENATESSAIHELMESGKLSYIIYTGAALDETTRAYIKLHRKAMQLGIPCITSLDTAGALAEMIESRFNINNTELVDINNMRHEHSHVKFTKMHSCGNDYIFIENFDGKITCPESLCVNLCAPHYGIGADGIVLIEHSDKEGADAKMRTFNKDGSEGKMAGNNIRCVAKYLYDNGFIEKDRYSVNVEIAGNVHKLKLYTRDGKVSSVSVDMGKVSFMAKDIPAITDDPTTNIINQPLKVIGEEFMVTCLSIGNPHCVTFGEGLDKLWLEKIGPEFEHHPMFPERINTEFVRPVNRNTLRMRVWERGNGETLACGTGACAAVAAAVVNGLCDKGSDVTVKLLGGDLVVNYTDEKVTLTGAVTTVFNGEFEY